MKIYHIIAVGVFLLITSCSNLMNRSITEELTEKELNKLINKDPSFASTYFYIDMKRDYLSSTTDKAMWYDLTYSRFHKLYTSMYNEELINKNEEVFEKEWESKYGHYIQKVDSISEFYKKYRDENALESFVKIELVDVEKEIRKGIRTGEDFVASVSFVLSVTPLKGTIDGILAYYGIVEYGKTPFYSYLETTGRNKVNIQQPFNTPQIIKSYPTMGFEMNDYIKQHELKDFLKRYDFQYLIYYIDKNGERLTLYSQTENIPYEVRNIWENEQEKDYNDWKQEYDIKKVVEGVLKEEYKNKSTYIEEREKQYFLAQDELAASFYYL